MSKLGGRRKEKDDVVREKVQAGGIRAKKEENTEDREEKGRH